MHAGNRAKKGNGEKLAGIMGNFGKMAGKGMCHNAIIAATATRFSRKVTRVQVTTSVLCPSIRVR